MSTKQLVDRANAAWDRDDHAGALTDFAEVLRRQPDFPDIRNRAGLCRAMLGDSEEALHEFEHAIRINPEYAEAHLNRALVLNDLGRFDEARESFDRAGSLGHRADDPFPADLGNRIALDHAKLGDLYLQADRTDAAVSEYAKALEIRPEFVDIRTRLATAFMAAGDPDRAAVELRRVVKEQPSFLAARIRLGVALQQIGHVDEAIQEWRRCLEVEPGDRRTLAYLASAGVRIEEVFVEGVLEERAGS